MATVDAPTLFHHSCVLVDCRHYIFLSDSNVSIAKNYLKRVELDDMGRIVNAFLDLAERRAKRHIPMTMEDWAKQIDRFLEADDMPILDEAGTVSTEEAKAYAEAEFEKYRPIQDRLFRSDFDRLNEGLLRLDVD